MGQVVRSCNGGASLVRMVLKVTRMRAIHCSCFQDPIKQKDMKKLSLGKSAAGSSGFRRSHLLKLSCVSDSRVLHDDAPENQYGFFITCVGCEQIATEKSKDMARGSTSSKAQPHT